MTTNNRIAILVDNENLYYGLRDHPDFGSNQYRIDYQALFDKLAKGRTVVASIIYCAIRNNADPTNFFHKLRHCGFEVKAKKGYLNGRNQMECDWDIKITIDAVELVDRIDTLVLVSSDSDFMPVVEYARSRARTVELHSWIPFSRKDFQQSASFFYPLGIDILEPVDVAMPKDMDDLLQTGT